MLPVGSGPDGLLGALGAPGSFWAMCLLVAAMLLAGLVRGFAGFGTALIFMPVATHILPMGLAIAVLALTDMASWPAIVPRALRNGDRREVGLLAVAAIVATPVGVWLLGWVDEVTLRWCVSALVALTLAALISGWRFSGRIGWPGLLAIGLAAGLTGGATGLTGPPVILFYLAGAGTAIVVRANTILFLAITDIAIIANLWLQGQITASALWLALLLLLPYGGAMLMGQRLFRPEHEKVFRRLAYVIIGGAALAGLPLFG